MIRLREIHLDRCIEVTGNDRTARFMRSLMRWYQYTKVVHGGHKWVSMTRAEWGKELHLSPQQIRLVLEKLSAAGLIVREQHRFKGSTPLFVRPTEKCLSLFLIGSGHPTKVGLEDPPCGGLKHPTHLKPHKKPEGKPKDASGFAVASLEEKKEEEDSGKKEESDDVVGAVDALLDVKTTLSHAQEIEKDFETMPELRAPNSDKVSTLMAIWKDECKAKGLPPAEVDGSMCDDLVKIISTIEVGFAPLILTYAIRHWNEFSVLAEKSHGAFMCPKAPDLGFIAEFGQAVWTLVHRDADIYKNAYTAAKAAQLDVKVSKETVENAVDKPITGAKIQELEAEQSKPATLAELLEIENELKAAS